MPARDLLVLVSFAVLGVASAAHADDLDVDVAAFEYVDVVETTEGSILKGVVTEQMPNVKFKLATADGSLHVIKAADVVKITKQRNPKYRKRRASVAMIEEQVDEVDEPQAVRWPAPTPGMRIEPELAFVFPSGDLVNIAGSPLSYRTSFAPGARVGYEVMKNNIGIELGGVARYTSWRLPTQVASLGAHWTLETQAYARAALHVGRAAPFAGISLGVDTNYTHNNMSGVSTTAMGFGMNLAGGVAYAATRSTLIELGLDFHPGTDTIESGVDSSISYFAFRLGAAFRL